MRRLIVVTREITYGSVGGAGAAWCSENREDFHEARRLVHDWRAPACVAAARAPASPRP
jgi:hypothetical protein